MSVTFRCPDSPQFMTDCEWCKEARYYKKYQSALDGAWIEEGQELTEEEWGRITCDPYCNGSYLEGEAPEVNFSNYNARGVLSLLGLSNLYGELPPEDLSEILRRIDIINTNCEWRERLVEEPRTEIGERGARVFYGGNTDAQTLRRIAELRKVFEYAAQHGTRVSWD